MVSRRFLMNEKSVTPLLAVRVTPSALTVESSPFGRSSFLCFWENFWLTETSPTSAAAAGGTPWNIRSRWVTSISGTSASTDTPQPAAGRATASIRNRTEPSFLVFMILSPHVDDDAHLRGRDHGLDGRVLLHDDGATGAEDGAPLFLH